MTARMLVDVRESENLRGYHVLAALLAVAADLADVELWCTGGEGAEERIALQSFAFDTGLTVRPWRPALPGPDMFDIYVSVALVEPDDEATARARRIARRSIVALLTVDDGTGLDGHDTVALGRAVLAELRACAGAGAPR